MARSRCRQTHACTDRRLRSVYGQVVGQGIAYGGGIGEEAAEKLEGWPAGFDEQEVACVGQQDHPAVRDGPANSQGDLRGEDVLIAVDEQGRAMDAAEAVVQVEAAEVAKQQMGDSGLVGRGIGGQRQVEVFDHFRPVEKRLDGNAIVLLQCWDFPAAKGGGALDLTHGEAVVWRRALPHDGGVAAEVLERGAARA